MPIRDKSELDEGIKTKDGKRPNPNTIHPIAGYDKEIYVKPTITNPNIIAGDFTYIANSDFESHVSYLCEWNDNKIIIGKFCQIAAGVEFVMNGANHQMNAGAGSRGQKRKLKGLSLPVSLSFCPKIVPEKP